MLIFAGIFIVVLSTFGGYAALGGHLYVLWQPFEAVIICGAALGGYIIANPATILKRSGPAVAHAIKGRRHKKADSMELSSLLSLLFQPAKTKGILALDRPIETPQESTNFQ